MEYEKKTITTIIFNHHVLKSAVHYLAYKYMDFNYISDIEFTSDYTNKKKIRMTFDIIYNDYHIHLSQFLN